MEALPPDIERRLRDEATVWLSTVRGDGRPHVTPVWFVFDEGTWWIGCSANSVKVRNCRSQGAVALALEDGRAPVVAEGLAAVREQDFPAEVVDAFAHKYDGWDIRAVNGSGARALIEVATTRWLLRGAAR
ncbi:pyridoxamine 5'-phosphate oxidase family protein [Pseudonocardia parietis]|uniref:PPOX class probable F420-dependent enzyme n=1 Tax=Pseudonocardia parietis TaxID=570936 RepID=A0ABS4VNW5_9PSEU|nr:pyridoxamine 5'-phosphate oxidase family protein [Pseudonocardia parietis]MBP2365616.1 PPOX class probable F420-dependent enzyme [Pseudonocardia parietis]